MHAAIMLRDSALPNKPQVGCTRPAAGQLIAKCADMFPLVSDYTHTCFLLDLMLQLLLKLLLLSRRAHSYAVRLKISHLLRTERAPTIGLSSRGFKLLVYLSASSRIPPSLRAATPPPSESSDDGCKSAVHVAPAVVGDCCQPDSPCASRRMLVFISTSSSRASPCFNILAYEDAPEPTFRVV